MTRSFVLGIDCKLYYLGITKRDQDSTPTVPDQMMDYSGFDGVDIRTITFDPTNVSAYAILKTVQDVTLNLSSNTADLTNRYSNGWRQSASTLKDASIEFSILWEPDDIHFTNLMFLYLRQCPTAFMALDGPINGFKSDCTPGETPEGAATEDKINYSPRCGECGYVTGLHGDFIVTDFSRNEGLEEGVTADVTLQTAIGMIHPEWMIIPQQPAS